MIKIINDFFETNKMILNLISLKEEIIASNIANSETPNYTKNSINFKDIIKKISLIKKKKELTVTSNKHIKKNLNFINKNNYTNFLIKRKNFEKNSKIDINKEKIKFLKNSLNYELEVSIINKKIKNIYLAIQG